MSKLTRTSHSFYQNHSSPNKIAFQTKLKIRGNNQYLKSSHPDQDESHPEQYNINQSLVLRNNHSQSCFYSKEN